MRNDYLKGKYMRVDKIPEDGYLEKENFSYFKSYYSYVITALLIVGILGAVNAGLTKIA